MSSSNCEKENSIQCAINYRIDESKETCTIKIQQLTSRPKSRNNRAQRHDSQHMWPTDDLALMGRTFFVQFFWHIALPYTVSVRNIKVYINCCCYGLVLFLMLRSNAPTLRTHICTYIREYMCGTACKCICSARKDKVDLSLDACTVLYTPVCYYVWAYVQCSGAFNICDNGWGL